MNDIINYLHRKKSALISNLYDFYTLKPITYSDLLVANLVVRYYGNGNVPEQYAIQILTSNLPESSANNSSLIIIQKNEILSNLIPLFTNSDIIKELFTRNIADLSCCTNVYARSIIILLTKCLDQEEIIFSDDELLQCAKAIKQLLIETWNYSKNFEIILMAASNLIFHKRIMDQIGFSRMNDVMGVF